MATLLLEKIGTLVTPQPGPTHDGVLPRAEGSRMNDLLVLHDAAIAIAPHTAGRRWFQLGRAIRTKYGCRIIDLLERIW